MYSITSLSLPAPVTEERIDSPGTEYHFRCNGLRLLIHSADKYFLLPDGWSHGAGRAIILENAPTLRFEFAPAQPTGALEQHAGLGLRMRRADVLHDPLTTVHILGDLHRRRSRSRPRAA